MLILYRHIIGASSTWPWIVEMLQWQQCGRQHRQCVCTTSTRLSPKCCVTSCICCVCCDSRDVRCASSSVYRGRPSQTCSRAACPWRVSCETHASDPAKGCDCTTDCDSGRHARGNTCRGLATWRRRPCHANVVVSVVATPSSTSSWRDCDSDASWRDCDWRFYWSCRKTYNSYSDVIKRLRLLSIMTGNVSMLTIDLKAPGLVNKTAFCDESMT